MLIFLEGMAECGWASRCRWDRGKENIGAIIEQIDHYYDPATPSTLHRGSAITVSFRLLLFFSNRPRLSQLTQHLYLCSTCVSGKEYFEL